MSESVVRGSVDNGWMDGVLVVVMNQCEVDGRVDGLMSVGVWVSG